MNNTRPPNPAQPVAGHPVLESGDTPTSILLIDDDDDCRLLVSDAIADFLPNNRVHEACDGLTAISMLTGSAGESPLRPGLILLDIEMPGIDGQQTLRRIRRIPELDQTPVVMMTGVSDPRQMQLAADGGANSYTLKPADPEQFVRTVLISTLYWLGVHQTPERHRPQSHCRRTIPDDPPTHRQGFT